MAIPGIQVINVGLQNESTGSDSLYTAFNKTKTNFATLFGNASPFNTFTANTGIGITSNTSSGTVDITNTGVISIIPGTGISIDSSNGNVTISSTGGGNGGGGTVTSVNVAPVSTQRLTVTGSPIVSSGTINIDLATTGVSAGTYTYPTMAVDTYGRITSISSGTSLGTVTSVGITPGFGIQVTGSPVTSNGTMTIQNTGVTRLNAGTGITLSGSNGNVTVSTTTGGGTVTSVGVSSSTLTVSGSPVVSSGTINIEIPNSLNRSFVYQPQWMYHGAQLANTSGICFSSDGYTVLLSSSSSATIYKYTLTTAWDLSTGSYSGQTYDASVQTTAVRSIRMNLDGTRFYIASATNDMIYQYNMSTAYNLTTASYASSCSISGQETEIRGLDFKPDGLRFYIIGNTNKKIYQYNMTVPWDISTAVYSGTSSPTVNTTTPQGLAFSPAGTKLFVIGQGRGSEIEQYTLTAWDITTISYNDWFINFSYYEITPTDLALNSDGTQIYTCGVTPYWNRIWAFKFSIPYDIGMYSKYYTIVSSTDLQNSVLVNRDTSGNIVFAGATCSGNIFSTTGKLGLGTLYSDTSVVIGTSMTGGANVWGISNEGVIANTVTANAYYSAVYNSTASNTNLGNLINYLSGKGTWGSGTTVANQYGFFASSFLSSATNNYGFFANIAAASNTYNFYANGTAQNKFSGDVLIFGAGGLGYTTGSGGAVTQGTSRTTGVTLNKTNGAITLVSAAGSATWQSFTVTNSTVAATDTIIVNQKSGTDLYLISVTAIAAGSFRISFATTGGTTTEQPVFNFSVIKAVAA